MISGSHISFWNYLSLLDSIVGAYRCAATAADACVGIDLVDVTLRNCLYGAYRNTCTASYAAVGDYISHSYSKFLMYIYVLIVRGFNRTRLDTANLIQ